ncbi:hypothetical protein M8009_18375 [Halomonas sp. ATCH28]|uniref:Uncharacterized protein n=1 Tax=Halomonas gemina TaxID=2945105 RepID=A0ABT0T647_9GAMM|nr:hypothetical protein [Halomonas gemina]MCL7942248.1 hypothetical protein [Halomonas gemina]
MSILLVRQGDDLKVDIDELSILVRGRYRRRSLRCTMRRLAPIINIDTLFSASKNLDDGETTVLKATGQIDLENNIDRAIRDTMNEIPKEERRKWLNESIAKSLPW